MAFRSLGTWLPEPPPGVTREEWTAGHVQGVRRQLAEACDLLGVGAGSIDAMSDELACEAHDRLVKLFRDD